MQKLQNSMIVDVVNKFGKKLDEIKLRNTALAELYPGKRIIQIQWISKDYPKPTLEEILTPIQYGGRSYYGAYAWGSAVKRGMTIGLESDWVTSEGPVKMVEDGQRVGRWLLAQGLFGGFRGDIKIGILPPGTLTKAGPIEDGFGYIRRSLADKYATKQRINLGTSRDNWTYWQRIPWKKVQDEMLPLLDEAVVDASDPARMLFVAPQGFEDKKALYDADNVMIEHPFVAASLARASQDYFARLASSVFMAGKYKTAVPTTAPTVCCKGFAGKVVIDRSPIDSNGSVQAVDIEPDPEEEERIARMEVIQVSISGRSLATKGCLGVVDDDLIDYDIVICNEDIKMAPDLKAARKEFEMDLQDVVVTFLQLWSGPSLCGVNAEWAKKKMGLDHDGDGVRLVDASHLPELWKAVRDLPEEETPKLKKTKRLIEEADLRSEMVFKSMANLVGFATNVAGATYMVSDRQYLAKQLGYKDEEALDKRLNFFIKVGTDGFKTDVDQNAVQKEIAFLQANIRKLYGVTAPWTKWGDDWAFRYGLPPIILEKYEDGTFLIDGEDEPRQLSDKELANAIWPWMDGTIAEIARQVIPAIAPNWTETVKMRPLTAFRSWAKPVSGEEMEEAREVQFWFNARVGRVNWTDPKSILEFKADYLAIAKCNPDALWLVAHSSRSENSGAASVFMAFPEECLEIIKNKPGLKDRNEVVLTGINYQIPGFISGEIEIKIGDVTTLKNGKKVIRKALFGSVPGQVPPRDKTLPRDLIGFVAANSDQPQDGQYWASVKMIGQSSWKAELIPTSEDAQ